VEAALAFAMAGDGGRPQQTLPAGHPDAIAMAASNSRAFGAQQQESG